MELSYNVVHLQELAAVEAALRGAMAPAPNGTYGAERPLSFDIEAARVEATFEGLYERSFVKDGRKHDPYVLFVLNPHKPGMHPGMHPAHYGVPHPPLGLTPAELEQAEGGFAYGYTYGGAARTAAWLVREGTPRNSPRHVRPSNRPANHFFPLTSASFKRACKWKGRLPSNLL